MAAIGVSVVGFALLSPGSALAGTLDQQQTDSSGGNLAIHQSQSLAQTFTPGLTGGLDRVDLNLGTFGTPTAYLTVEIRDVSGGIPGNTILASRSAPASSVPATNAFVSVNFALPAQVVAGTQYAIVVYTSAASPNFYQWFYSPPTNPYAGGGPFVTLTTPPSGTWTSFGTAQDLAFKTYVVPNPGSTGQRTAALAKCKHKHGKKRKKCKKKANLLPV